MYEATQGSDIVTIDDGFKHWFTNWANDLRKYRPKNPVIVTNPNTGEVLSMANFPGYDISHRGRGRRWNGRHSVNSRELTDKYFEAWRNPAVSNVYEPGSVYKALTTAAAIDEGTATKTPLQL